MTQPQFIPLPDYREYAPPEMLARARACADEMQRGDQLKMIVLMTSTEAGAASHVFIAVCPNGEH